jgi:GT2 family glycosyltransferase
MDISIVIVNYNTKELALNCLKSIKAADWYNLTYEIIVVDNNSREPLGDALTKLYPEVKFIQSESNLGMGRGNNLGFDRTGKYFVVMNADTIAMPDTFQILYHYLENNSQVGIVGPKQMNLDHSVQQSCYRYHKLLTPFYRRTFLGATSFGRADLERFLMTDFDHYHIKEVDWLLGSFYFMRGEVYKSLGGFDERFFLYFEDTDLCRRCHQAGWQVVYNPAALFESWPSKR